MPEASVHRYELEGGREVLVGKTERDNDLLSLRIAAPEDFWFHVHGCPGSHVILRCAPGEDPGKEALEAAASIAAWHSKARAAGTVPVSCTRAKHVSKPRGAKPGTVTIRKEITLKVRPGLP
jgi:predicted ribosome quality control (RQC) complex YloA/Tae2 family protein